MPATALQSQPHRKRSRRLAEDLVLAIETGRYKPGGKLPTERDLCEQYAVSRPTVREALIMLEGQGMVETRHGQGILVLRDRRPGALRLEADTTIIQLLEACRLFEAEAAALSASAVDMGQARAVMALVEVMDGEEGRTPELCRQFHLGVAQLSGNGAIVATIENLWDVIVGALEPRAALERILTRRATELSARYRRAATAIVAGEPAEARTAIRELLGDYMDYVLQQDEDDALALIRQERQGLRRELARRGAA